MAPTTVDRLRQAGLRATGPRVVVLDVLGAARDLTDPHLTVAEVADRARSRLGRLSTQAAYDCLDALVRSGLAHRIEPAGHPARFEARTGDNHHHMVCRQCGRTVDVDCVQGAAPCLSPGPAPVTGGGFVVDEAEVIFWGRCPTCSASTSPDPSYERKN